MRYGHDPRQIDDYPYEDVMTLFELLPLLDPLAFGGGDS